MEQRTCSVWGFTTLCNKPMSTGDQAERDQMVRSNSILLFGSSDGTNSLLMKRPVDTLIVVFDLGTGISATAAIVDGEQG